MRTNVTIRLDATLLRETRALAAKEGTSFSALVTKCLEQVVNQNLAYSRARKRSLARLRKGLDLHWTRSDSRDELHER